MSFQFVRGTSLDGQLARGLPEAMSASGAQELPASLGQHVLEACSAPMIVFECRANDCRVTYANPAFARRTGYSPADIVQIGWDALHMDGGRARGMRQLYAAIRARRDLDVPVRVHGKHGVTFSASLHVSPVGDAGAHTPRYAVGVLRDQAADPEYVSRLEREAHYDPLTGLMNRRVLTERAERAIAWALQEKRQLGVALLDLDGFKPINDTMGHAAGDEVLCAVGARLARELRAGDLVARTGGDEFVLVLQEVPGDFSFASVIERVRHHIEQPMQLHGQSITIGCSIGVAVCPGNGKTLDSLLKYADRAMYRQKARGRSMRSIERYARYSPPSMQSISVSCAGSRRQSS